MEIQNSSPLELAKFLQLQMELINGVLSATDNHGGSGDVPMWCDMNGIPK